MTETWLRRAQKLDYRYANGRGGMNGPFAAGRPIGVAVHVNVSGPTSNGTSTEYFRDNPGQVLPNFQVYRDGKIVQFTPLEWQSWCQVAGNFTFGAIECGGDPDMPYTDQQIDSIGYVLAAYHSHFGVPLVITDSPYEPGIGTHQMGGAAWGGHACPGVIRAGERPALISAAKRQLGGPPNQTKPPRWYHVYKRGDRGPSVRTIQKRLVHLGYVPHVTDATADAWCDGLFGPPTVYAVKRAKKDMSWPNRTGRVGLAFWNKLLPHHQTDAHPKDGNR
jgi:hypothetical protein